jgi:hypothetical protein
MKTTAKMDIVNYLLGLFATAVLLVAWPRGKKGCKGVKWSQVTLQDMMDPGYLDELAEGNIGVILGPASGGIASIDIDDDHSKCQSSLLTQSGEFGRVGYAPQVTVGIRRRDLSCAQSRESA